jgi:hypothetical protein
MIERVNKPGQDKNLHEEHTNRSWEQEAIGVLSNLKGHSVELGLEVVGLNGQKQRTAIVMVVEDVNNDVLVLNNVGIRTEVFIKNIISIKHKNNEGTQVMHKK